MGLSGGFGHQDGVHKDILGWLGGGRAQIVTTTGSYTLNAYEDQTANVKVIKVPRTRDASNAVTSYYYLEYRKPTSNWNSYLTGRPDYGNGVLVHTTGAAALCTLFCGPDFSGDGGGGDSHLIDTEPNTLGGASDFDDAPLLNGQSYTDVAAGMSVLVTASDSTSATVFVTVFTHQLSVQTVVFPAGAGSVSGAGTFVDRQSVSLTASPSSGHVFLVWRENRVKQAYPNPYSFAIHGDRFLEAVFGTGTAVNANFTVNSTADQVDSTPGDGVCETGTGNAVCTLRAAVMESNALLGTHTITVPAGTYQLTRVGTDDTAVNGDLDITGSTTIVGAGSGRTIVDGNGISRVFHILGDANATVRGLTVKGGNSVGANGGGIQVSGGVLTLDHVVIRDNQTSGSGGGFGGGLANFGGSVVTIKNSSITNNTASSNGGGITQNNGGSGVLLIDSEVSGNHAVSGAGIISGGVGNATSVTLTRSTVANNVGTGNGGGILISNDSTLVLTASHIAGNKSAYGGGIYVNATATLTMDGSTINNNQATNNGGGVDNLGTATIQDSTIRDNVSANFAGGFNNLGLATLRRVTVNGNAAGTGGGRGFSNATGATLTIENGTISGNTSPSNGGGITSNTGSTTTLNNSTIVGNSAVTVGGGINPVGTTRLKNSIVANNTAGSAVNCSGPVTSWGYNLESANGCGLAAGGDLINTAPLLGALANNGGPTQTHALLAGSPAITAGNSAAPGSGGDACLADDQRGTSRTTNAPCDIGAFESTSVGRSLTITLTGAGSGTVTADGINCPGDCSQSYPENTAVSLSATPAAGSRVASWSGACGRPAPCTVTMTRDQTVMVAFEPLPGCTPGAPTIAASPIGGHSIHFEGTPSTPAGCTVELLTWSFGDGQTATGATADHAYAAAGSVRVTLQVRYVGGQVTRVQQTITVP